MCKTTSHHTSISWRQLLKMTRKKLSFWASYPRFCTCIWNEKLGKDDVERKRQVACQIPVLLNFGGNSIINLSVDSRCQDCKIVIGCSYLSGMDNLKLITKLSKMKSNAVDLWHQKRHLKHVCWRLNVVLHSHYFNEIRGA